MTSDERRLFTGLLEALVERFSSLGHPMQLVTNERLGYCTVKGCAPSCLHYAALLCEASEMLEAALEAVEAPTQGSLFDAGEAAG